jgi:NTP pyrophosphatase (non-canonical NTP hydrolase)
MKPNKPGIWKWLAADMTGALYVVFWKDQRLAFYQLGRKLYAAPPEWVDEELKDSQVWSLEFEFSDDHAPRDARKPTAEVVAMVYDATLAIVSVFLPDDLPEFVRSQIEAAHDCYRQVMNEEPMSIKAAAVERRNRIAAAQSHDKSPPEKVVKINPAAMVKINPAAMVKINPAAMPDAQPAQPVAQTNLWLPTKAGEWRRHKVTYLAFYRREPGSLDARSLWLQELSPQGGLLGEPFKICGDMRCTGAWVCVADEWERAVRYPESPMRATEWQHAEHNKRIGTALGKLAPKGTYICTVLEDIWRAETLEGAEFVAKQAHDQMRRLGLWGGPRTYVHTLEKLAETAKAIKNHAWLERFRKADYANKYHEQSPDACRQIAGYVDKFLDAVIAGGSNLDAMAEAAATDTPAKHPIEDLHDYVGAMIRHNVRHKTKQFNIGDMTWTDMCKHLLEEAGEVDRAGHASDCRIEMGDVLGVLIHMSHFHRMSVQQLCANAQAKLLERFEPAPLPPVPLPAAT